MKKIINYFIRYHVAVNVVIVAFLLFGILGLKSLKSSFFPLTESHIIRIAVVYPGASPIEIEEGVILKIEDNLKGLRGVERVTSVSSENTGYITVEIEEELDINFMLLEVKNAVDRVPSYPTGMEPLVVYKQEPQRSTINFALTAENKTLLELKKIGRQIENELRSIPGISQISVSGYPDEEIEIAIDRNKLFFVEHEIDNYIDYNKNPRQDIITLRSMDYKNAKTIAINPHYFGNFKVSSKNSVIVPLCILIFPSI